MGRWHFGQVGGAGFFGITLTLDQARAFHSLSPNVAGSWAVMKKVYKL
jgi:hypothetical protein